jgi:pimeloyl-ACP methyl ester carboxylesterase
MPSPPLSSEAAKLIWFESHGCRLFAVESGEGAPLIYLHGGLANHFATRHLIGALRGRVRAITPDLRGSGKSVHAADIDWQVLADDVVSLANHLGLHRVVVGGVSFGSGVALATALQHPDRVAGLVIVSPMYRGTERGLTPAQCAVLEKMNAFGSRVPTEGLQALDPLFAPLPSDVRQRVADAVRSFDPASVAATTKFLASEVQPFGSLDELTSIRAPALIVAGNDPQHPREIADLYAQNLPTCAIHPAVDSDFADAIVEMCARATGA